MIYVLCFPFTPTQVTSLSLKLQKLQEKAVEDGDYDTGEFEAVHLGSCVVDSGGSLCSGTAG